MSEGASWPPLVGGPKCLGSIFDNVKPVFRRNDY